jgi:hypothetical protein
MRTKARKAFLHSAFTTALEGGIGYWSECEEYVWSKPKAGPTKERTEDLDGFHAWITNNESDWGVGKAYQPNTTSKYAVDGWVELEPDATLVIDIDVVERGVNMLVDAVVAATKSEDPEAPFNNKYLRQFVEAWLTDGDGGDYDANGADLAIQLGLFGEVVYA